MKDVSICIGIVLYKNDENELYRCLNGLKTQVEASLIGEVLIRDQGGGECREYVENWIEKNPGVLNIRFSEGDNLGFGGGHNILFKDASPTATAYLCLNPDGVMHPDCLGEMVKVAERERWRGIFEAIQEPVMHPKHYSPQTGLTAWCSGACLLIPCAIYREIGGYDEDYFLYCEDVDISWRVKGAGYHCYTCASALFFHYAMDRSSRAIEIWKSAYILGHKWRSTNFRSHAQQTLASLIDVQLGELKASVEALPQHPLDMVFRAAPDFHNNLVFSKMMWTP